MKCAVKPGLPDELREKSQTSSKKEPDSLKKSKFLKMARFKILQER